MTDLCIGTSAWDYGHWRDSFYPRGERPNICRYAEHVDTVEINNSFYRLPSAQTFGKWRDQTPEDFLFMGNTDQVLAILAARRLLLFRQRSESLCGRETPYG